jgi:hypothetical protein
MDTINAVFKAGSIAKMVKTKKLTKGIMYECVKNNIPFVLAGSIRDDDSVSELIRSGYIDGVLAGNALAVHDIEYATLVMVIEIIWIPSMRSLKQDQLLRWLKLKN